jgi:heptaprenyl diphosphate synthase
MLTPSLGKKNGAQPCNPGSLALLGALCLFLSVIEYMIPKPLPFLRIGLANLPLMLALGVLPLRDYIYLVFIKISGQALVTGTLFSYIFLFSLAGTLISAMTMYFLHRVFHKHITFTGIGTAGAFISNISQLLLARIFIFGENTFYIAPFFLLSGLITGIALGVFCEVFAGKSAWYNNHFNAAAGVLNK